MTNDDALPCKEAVELVTEYLEKVMLPQMRRRLEEHVENRPGCENHLEQVQLTFIITASWATSWSRSKSEVSTRLCTIKQASWCV
jgi:hypothetical protein